jgi:hypothetical protein
VVVTMKDVEARIAVSVIAVMIEVRMVEVQLA